jgi:EAL domain-containing protein (putative c-di-GMP-specific phosphodiesterase class I)
MDARLLELDIHENVKLRDFKKTLRVLTGIKEMGIQIAIEGYGIGKSTPSTIEQFPIDTINIDRSFIRDPASVGEDKNLSAKVDSNTGAADKA